ncbi:regucalcin-like [Oppia nitens]|uniref:regucalcin-like n=1 Tax=Oppia nitens TaxID=1686743 RepID=UPI0023DA9529|nr:regucalcin-like [Oppia nitens]
MSSFHVQIVSQEPVDWGESPHWDQSRQRLSYVDCFAKRIHQIDPESGRCDRYNIVSAASKSTPMTTMAIPTDNQCDTEYVISLGNSLAKYLPNSGDIYKLADIDGGTYFNDGKCDSRGRLWIGSFTGEPGNPMTMVKGAGKLYEFSNDTLTTKYNGLTIPNGITWSSDNSKLFAVDTMERAIYYFDYDNSTATIGKKRTFFASNSEFSFKGTEIPYGLTVDLKGNLWLVVYYGGKILNIDSNTAKVINKIDLSANMVTSACFGGIEMNELFVTSSNRGLPAPVVSAQQAGHTFKVTCFRDNSFKGQPSNCFRLQ